MWTHWLERRKAYGVHRFINNHRQCSTVYYFIEANSSGSWGISVQVIRGPMITFGRVVKDSEAIEGFYDQVERVPARWPSDEAIALREERDPTARLLLKDSITGKSKRF